MKGYSDSGTLTAKQHNFNYCLSRARFVVENGFVRLKREAEVSCLLKHNDTKISFLLNIIAACCTLHNLCELHGNAFDEEWAVDSAKPLQVRQLVKQLLESMILSESAMLLQIIYTKTNRTYCFISNNYNQEQNHHNAHMHMILLHDTNK